LRLAYSALELSPWAMRLTLWGTLDARAEPTWPARPFRRSQLCTCAGQRYCAAISGALSTRPNVDGVAGRIQRSELLHRVTPCGLSNRARRTPRSWRGLPPRRSPTLGSVHSGDEGPLVSGERLCSHRCGPWGLWIRSPTRSAGVSMDAK